MKQLKFNNNFVLFLGIREKNNNGANDDDKQGNAYTYIFIWHHIKTELRYNINNYQIPDS